MHGRVAAKTRSHYLPWLFLALGVGLLLVNMAGGTSLKLSPEVMYAKLFWPFLKLLGYLGVGLFLGQVIEALGWTARLGKLVRPLIGWGRFGTESAAAFSTSFFSGIVANTLLMGYYQEGKLSLRELRLSYLLNTGLPAFVLHLPTTFFILAPLTGMAGIIYLGLNLLAASLRTLGVLAYAHFTLKPTVAAREPVESAPQARGLQFAALWKKFQKRFLRLICYTMPIYIMIFLAQQAGFFDYARQATAGLITVTFLPLEAASVIIFSVAAEFSSGAAAAGALMAAGALTTQQTVVALMLGSIVAAPIRALRHQLPTHAGIFSPKLGGQLLLTSQALRILSLIIVTGPYIWWS